MPGTVIRLQWLTITRLGMTCLPPPPPHTHTHTCTHSSTSAQTHTHSYTTHTHTYIHIRTNTHTHIHTHTHTHTHTQTHTHAHSHTQVSTLKSQLNDAHLQYLELKMTSEQEIISLEQQVQAMQKVKINSS